MADSAASADPAVRPVAVRPASADPADLADLADPARLAAVRDEEGRALLGSPPAGWQVVVLPADPRADLDAERLAAVEFLVANGVARYPGPELLARLPGLRVVQSMNAGVDWLVPHLGGKVTLCDGRGVHDASVAEWVVGALLADCKLLPAFVRAQGERRWIRTTVGDLEGRTILIVGYGSIGAALEDRLAPFGTAVLRLARTGRAGERPVAPAERLLELLPRADAVVLLVPLTAATRGLIGRRELAAMADGALLVNASRGAVVDTGALLAELTAGRLRAALDVTDPEPLGADHPLWTAPGLLLTPHVAGLTQRYPRRAYALAARQLARYAAGQPLANVVTGDY